MTSLFPFQSEILERLRDPSCPPHGVVVAPSGSGVRRPVVVRVSEVASESVALVLCASVVMAEQWGLLLREAGATVLMLDSAQVALDFLERRPRYQTGVVVTTFQRLLHGPSSQVLAGLDYGLIVLDELPPIVFDRVDWLPNRAERMVALTARPMRDRAYENWPIIWSTTREQLVDEGQIAVAEVSYELTAEEAALRSKAIRLLQNESVHHDERFALSGDSFPVLHAKLLALTSESNDKDISEQAWAILDSMEEMSAVDSRLVALRKLTSQVIDDDARCVVMADARADVRYIADHLLSLGTRPSAIINSATPKEDRISALRRLAPGGVIVTTNVLCERANLWPMRTTIVLWPFVDGRPRIPSELAMLLEARPDIRVYALRAAEASG